MTKRMWSLSTLTAIVGIAAALVLSAGAAGAKTSKSKGKKGKPDSGTIYAATTHFKGNIDYVAGQGTDKRFGAVAVTYTVSAVQNKPGTITLNAKPVTTYTKKGSLSGVAHATVTVGLAGAATVKGTLSETKGTGALKGHRFDATFTGTGNVSTGVYVFKYKGTLK